MTNREWAEKVFVWLYGSDDPFDINENVEIMEYFERTFAEHEKQIRDKCADEYT